jgi:hypothetical protein
MKPLLDHLPAEEANRVELCRENGIGVNHVLMALSRKMEIAKYDPDEASRMAIELFDAIVLTRDEYAKLQQEAFARGIHYEQMQGNGGFKPR